ncbi:neural cell adhesion molecule L1.1-like isoform X2 [Thalassophryne amazonica]|uniref:neural cell adhesion molecule L1.1-like isoform X2 n=1 Tax=Thalassophryne amazonica TaxID=390379 RepID=UPI001472287E|nr:neural cell adhesion molecule L1.1-like isoform X2 [Thalassophryne amazonica]
MCMSQRRWTGYRGPQSPALLLILVLLPSFFSTAPFAQGHIEIPKDYKVLNMSEPPVLIQMPTSYTAFSQEDINMNCEASGNPTPTFRWVKDGKMFGPELNGSGSVRAEEDELLESYEGFYQCYASNMLGTAVTQTIQVIVEPQPVLLKQQKQHTKAYEGESIILTCNPPESSTPPDIHWMDKKMVHISKSGRVTVGRDGNLYFSNLLKSDTRDDYICNAQYTAARIILPAASVSLTVLLSNEVVRGRKPEFFLLSGPHTHILALRKQSLTLECIPKGLPTPKMEWRKKDGNLDNTGGKLEKFDRWLNFDSITEDDDGEYECKASNSHGSTSHSFIVTVEAAPYWLKEPQNLRYAPGETVRMNCQAEGIPKPIITWSINGQPLTEVDDDPRRNVSGGVLILRDVTFGDTAVYQCEATNKHGSILLNTYLHVIELPPQILSSDGMVYRVTEGGEAKMHCESFGSPRPHVTWEGEDNVPLLSDPRISLLTNGTLELVNVSYDDRGAYTCSVKHTNISITAHLEVFNRTVITRGPQNIRVLRGTNALLDCLFHKDRQLHHYQIVWRKRGSKIQESSPDDKYTIFENGTLRVTDVQSDDTTSYSCEVITELDRVTARGYITVVARPDPPKDLSLSVPDAKGHNLMLSWVPGPSHNSPITEFIVEAREEQHLDEGKWRWEKWMKVSGDFNHLELTLQPFCTYRFRVISVNEYGHSDPSLPSDYYSTPPAVPSSNPTGVHSESKDPGTMIVMWDEMNKILHNGQDFQYKVSWRQADTNGKSQDWNHGYAKSPPFFVNNTGTYTRFDIKVQAVNALGEGPSPVSKIGHSGEDLPLEAPGGVAVTVINSTVRVKWNEAQKVQGRLRGYKLYIKRLGPKGVRSRRYLGKHHHAEGRDRQERVDPGNSRDEDKVVVVHGNKTSAEVTGLRLYSRYELSVTAFNSKGEGPRCQPEVFSTPEGAPGPPTSLRFESPTEKSLILYWTPPAEPNGILLGYVLQYQQKVESRDSLVQMEIISDPSVNHFELDNLDPSSYYIFTLMARTAAGDGPPITESGATLLDGVPPSNITMVAGDTSVNLSWVPGERDRNHGFSIYYQRKGVGRSTVEVSEMVNSTQGFYSLTGLQPGSQYHFVIKHGNNTYWDNEIRTAGPEVSEVAGGFATQSWFIGLISAIVLLILILLILFLIKRSKGGKYAVKDKEDKEGDSEARPMKDETFGEYSDGDEKRSDSQPSLCGDSKLGSDDSLAEYGDSVDIQFNEDGSFIGQYSGRGPVPQGNESSGPASPVNAVPPPPIAPSMSTILDRPS